MDELTKRTLVVVYKLSKGQVGRPVQEKDIVKEIENNRIYEMNNAEFDKYHQEVLKEVKENNN